MLIERMSGFVEANNKFKICEDFLFGFLTAFVESTVATDMCKDFTVS